MTKVKICGITNLDDATHAIQYGADSLGFNFYEKSHRFLKPHAVKEIIQQLVENVEIVGVFVNESIETIVQTVQNVGINTVQLHGDERSEFLTELRSRTKIKIIKAMRVSSDFKPEHVLKYQADAILLDAYSPLERGGTGETFDWEIAKTTVNLVDKMYLAGGLNAENVANAIKIVKPYAVDVASGVESSPSRKNLKKLEAFIKNAKNA